MNTPLARALVVALIATGLSGPSGAAPHTPTDDQSVVATLPGTTAARRQARQLARQVHALGTSPAALPAALQQARAAIDRFRRDGDPREIGVAQAALAPWWTQAAPPPAVRLLRASIRQTQHDFGPALVDLDALIASPQTPLALQAQAELIRLALLQAQGRLDDARLGCERLGSARYAALGDGVRLPAAVCAAELASLMGDEGRGARALAALAAQVTPQSDPGTAAWLALVQGELAERRGDPAALGLFERALQLQPEAYTRAALADWLLDHQRHAEVLRLTEGPLEDLPDSVLLRRAIALKRLGDPRAAAAADLLGQRLDATRARGDTTHQREQARYLLELRGQPQAALPLAVANWAAQKEPADARLLLDCATAAGQPQAAHDVLRHLRVYHQRDARLTAALVPQPPKN
ncbi:hypothetical protein [Sphaerotilus sp.]|uniref:hypothetical protein n=1 Tax=Sphaerotilus sp. TaxID=2093942 RepID=UPI00286E9BA0|nr:hypothetical protein [Sphaerotilus sp.]